MKRISVAPSTNVVISISSSEFSSNCGEVIKTLKSVGIAKTTFDITPNQTITKTSREQGCRIVFGVAPEKSVHKEVKKIWTVVKKNHNLTCAHINISQNWSGCVYDYFRSSSCPHLDDFH